MNKKKFSVWLNKFIFCLGILFLSISSHSYSMNKDKKVTSYHDFIEKDKVLISDDALAHQDPCFCCVCPNTYGEIPVCIGLYCLMPLLCCGVCFEEYK